MNEHERIQELLAIYRDLPEPERRELDIHLRGCPSCRARLDAYQGMDRELSSLRERDLDTIRLARLVRQLEQVKRQRPRSPWWSWLSGLPVAARQLAGFAALFLLTVGLLSVFGGRPSPLAGEEDSAQPGIAQTASAQPTSTLAQAEAPSVSTATPAVLLTSTRLSVCLASEPLSLWWAETGYAEQALLEALQEPLVDQRAYGFHPNLVEELPSLAGDSAREEEVAIEEGDRFYDLLSGTVLTLTTSITEPFSLRQVEGEPLVIEQWDGLPLTAAQVTTRWTLIDGLAWQDGSPVTSDDLLYGYELAEQLESLGGAPDFALQLTEDYQAIDSQSVEWRFVAGFDALSRGDGYPVPYNPQPRQHYGGRAAVELWEDGAALREPFSYGPYQIDEWIPGDRITLERNEFYARGPAALERIDFRFMHDRESILSELLTGECDVGASDAAWEDHLPTLRPLEEAGRVRIESAPGTVFEHLDFNLQPVDGYSGAAISLLDETGRPLFQNPDFRRAVAYCLDRPALIEATSAGAGFVQHGYMNGTHPYYPGDAAIATYPSDPEQGRVLLASLGWEDRDGDGIREDSAGQPLLFIYSTRESPLRDSVTQVIQAQLRERCGIDTTIELVGSEFFADGPDGAVFGRRYDVAQFAWLAGIEPPCDLYITSAIPGAGNGWDGSNNTGFSDSEFDDACAAARRSVKSDEKALLHAEALRLFTEQLPSIPLYARAKIAIVRPGVQGVMMDSVNPTEFWNIENIEVEQ